MDHDNQLAADHGRPWAMLTQNHFHGLGALSLTDPGVTRT